MQREGWEVSGGSGLVLTAICCYILKDFGGNQYIDALPDMMSISGNTV